MTPPETPRIYVLAGVNGAGKSSIGGAAFRAFGADYYNPDEAARALMGANPGLSQSDANSAAWHQGKRLLEQAMARRLDFAFETTLAPTPSHGCWRRRLRRASKSTSGAPVFPSPELHIERVRARVRKGGHDIPEADIRRRYQYSRLNLIHLLPKLRAVRVYDNSMEADPATGQAPTPRLLLHLDHGKIVGPADLSQTPDWAKPIAAAALKLHPGLE